MKQSSYLLWLSYEGTDFHGFQRQRNAPRTVQQVLETALETLYGQPVRVVPAGRTDAGVHARRQAASYAAPELVPAHRLPWALNSMLPPDLVVIGSQQVFPGFNARSQASHKTYRYTLDCGAFPDVFWRRRAWFVPGALDRRDMREAGRYLVGRHDFASFQAAGSSVQTTVRTVHRLQWDFSQAPLAHLYLCADGFLYKMARSLVGTLVEVGRGQRDPESMVSLLGERNRGRAGITAPARGLCLWDVHYPRERLTRPARGSLPPADAGETGGQGCGSPGVR